MSTDYKALCAELLSLLDGLAMRDPEMDGGLLRRRARAELAKPEPVGVTDEALLRTYGKAKRDHCYEGDSHDWPKKAERAATVAGLRAVLALCGNYPVKPDSSPANQPELVAPTDEELMAAARKAVDTYPRGSELPYFLNEDSSEYEPMLLALRAAARWGTPANTINQENYDRG